MTGRLALAAILVLGGGACTDTVVAPRPDVVIFVWDTCRADRVQPNGYALPTTPNLAEFAKEGTTFRRCYTPSPWTPPSHASLFTGLLPRHHGLREEIGDRVGPGIPLLAETLRDAGYETVLAAANAHISAATGLDVGFETKFPCFGSKEPGATGMDVGDKVVAWLDGRPKGGARKPFFLFVNLMETHLPYAFEEAEVAAVRGPGAVEGARKVAPMVDESAAGRHLIGIQRLDPAIFPDLNAAYDGSVRIADRVTGRILARLRKDGLLENAVVVVCGDHGESIGEHGNVGHVQSLAETVLHVPLVVRWTGKFAAGAAVDAQVRLQDVYPTLLAAAGVAAPPGCGTDATTLLEAPLRSRVAIAECGPSPKRVPVFAREFPDASPRVFEPLFRDHLAVQEPADKPGARKYVVTWKTTIGGPPEILQEALHDPVADPGEDRNLLGGTGDPKERATADRLRTLGGR